MFLQYSKIKWYERMKNSGIFTHSYLHLLHFPFDIVKKHTAYTLLVQLNNYQIQILKKKMQKGSCIHISLFH